MRFEPGGQGRRDQGEAPRCVPAWDVVVIGRRPAEAPPGPQPAPAHEAPRISRRRLALRVVLAAALVAEIAFAIRIWPREPVAIPDVAVTTHMIA